MIVDQMHIICKIINVTITKHQFPENYTFFVVSNVNLIGIRIQKIKRKKERNSTNEN